MQRRFLHFSGLCSPAFYGDFADYCRRDTNPATDYLTPHLLLENGDERGCCVDFLNDLYARVDEDESVTQMIVNTVIDISMKLSKMNMNDEYKPYINVSLDFRYTHTTNTDICRLSKS